MSTQENKKEHAKKFMWTGRVISTLVILFFILDAAIHLMNVPPVVAASAQLGLPSSMAFTIGIIECVCIILYIIPKTSMLGAILLTGYLGGAVAINLRANMPLFSNILFPVYTGIFVWGGLFFRENRLRSLIPFRR